MQPKREIFEVELRFNDTQEQDNVLNYNEITKKPFEVILHDFEVNENNSIIKREVAEKALPSLKDMPIVCQYYESTSQDPNDPNDGLGDHGVVLKVDREGDLAIATNSVAIGVFTDNAFIDTIIDENGNEKEVVKGKGILWKSRYPDIVGLLEDWWEQGIPIKSSMEILYNEYHVKDGILSIKNYIFEGHCILQSDDTEEHPKVDPAYKVSEITKFQRLVAQAVERENINQQKSSKKEEDNVAEKVFKKVYELSHDDIRRELYIAIDSTLEEDQYSYIVEVFDDYFIANIWGNGEDKYFKYTYTKNDETDEVSVNLESKTEVERVVSWAKATELQDQLNIANEKVEELQKQLNGVSEEKSTLETVKSELEKQLNSKEDTIKELQEYKDSVEKAKFEAQMAEKLKEQKSFYSAKFNALNAEEKFSSDEVQELVKTSIGEGEEAVQAKLQLNSMLVDMLEVKEQQEKAPIREMSSKTENLIPEKNDFDSRYMA